MKKTPLLFLALMFALCCAAEGGEVYVNEDAGFSFTVPDGFERQAWTIERSLLREAMRREERPDSLFAVNVWVRAGEEKARTWLEVQVKEPTYFVCLLTVYLLILLMNYWDY